MLLTNGKKTYKLLDTEQHQIQTLQKAGYTEVGSEKKTPKYKMTVKPDVIPAAVEEEPIILEENNNGGD
tara:strand:+ start:387 stop:593 length:207 start_codon:yes stop_codon:yes gene_type:complete